MDQSAVAAVATPLSAAPLVADRTLPVHDALTPLLPDGALVRGRSVACTGVTATSLALALTATAAQAGAWLAVVDVGWLGVEAAAELGIPLERLVRVDSDPAAGRRRAAAWAELMGAVLDGFELVVTRVPAAAGPAVVRRVHQRVQARGAVVVVIGETAAWSSDVTLRTLEATWEGVADGHGHLRARRVVLESSGRRVPRPRRAELWLPGPAAAVEAIPAPPSVLRPTG